MLVSIGHERDKATFTPFEVKSIGELAELILKQPYSLGTFKDDHRTKDNFIQTKAIGLDFDSGVTLWEATELFKDYMHIIAPSRNHQVEKNGIVEDRFRVILFLSSPITDNETFEATWYSLATKFPKLDKACKDSSRFFYPSKYIHSSSRDGNKVDPVAPKPKIEPVEKTVEINVDLTKGELGRRTLNFLLKGSTKGQRHNDLYAAARDAHQQGYSQEWFLNEINVLCDKTGDEAYRDPGALKTISDCFTKEPRHEPRIELKAFNMQRIGTLYEDKTEVEWLVSRLLSKGGVSLISADPKAGKSTLVRQLIRDVLRGSNFLERRCEQGAVFYFAIEEQKQIVNASFRRLGVTENDNLFIHMGDPLTNNSLEDFRELLNEHKPSLAVIDTLFDFLEVESENNYKEVKRELRRLRQIARESNTHIVLVHHNSKGQKDDKRRGNRGILGSQAIAGGVDTIMVIEVDGRDRLISSTGRDITNWYHREIIFNQTDHTYTLGPIKEEDY